jgi:hypothetical protein
MKKLRKYISAFVLSVLSITYTLAGKETYKEKMMGDLPVDILNEILGYFLDETDLYELLNFARTSKKNANLIERLDLSKYADSIDDAFLEKIVTAFPNLKKLNCSHCENITDKGMESIVKLKGLEFLGLDHCHKITNTGVEFISTNLTNLKNLSLSDCQITNESTIFMAVYLEKLTNLNLTWCPGITDTDLILLQREGLILSR